MRFKAADVSAEIDPEVDVIGRRHLRCPFVRCKAAQIALAFALSWSGAALATNAAAPGHVAAIQPSAGPQLLKLTLHPFGARRALPALRSGAWPAQAPLQLDTLLSVGVQYLHLVITGGHRAGMFPFLGTSTASVGGLRIRF